MPHVRIIALCSNRLKMVAWSIYDEMNEKDCWPSSRNMAQLCVYRFVNVCT
jgi:hypothetical protein